MYVVYRYGSDSPIPSLADGDWGRLTRGLATPEFMTDAVATIVRHLADPHIEDRRHRLMVTHTYTRIPYILTDWCVVLM